MDAQRQENQESGGNSRFPLDRAPLGKTVRVESIEGGMGIRRNLSQLGLHIGDELTVQRRGIIGGPIIVRLHGINMALGRGMAGRVLVSSSGES